MVELKTPYELNHIIYHVLENTSIPVGNSQDVVTHEIELFERSLALTSDVKRFPILRSLTVNFDWSESIAANMNSSGRSNASFKIYIWNASQEKIANDNLIFSSLAFIAQSTGTIVMIQVQNESWSFKGGALLGPEVTVRLVTSMAGNVTSVAFPEEVLNGQIFLEVDWFPLSKNQFKDIVLEDVYSRAGE